MVAVRVYKTTTEEAIRRHLAQRLTIAETAEALGVSPAMLRHTVSVLGIKSYGRGNKPPPKRRKSAAKPKIALANNPFGLGKR